MADSELCQPKTSCTKSLSISEIKDQILTAATTHTYNSANWNWNTPLYDSEHNSYK